jgi:hypothetical protein
MANASSADRRVVSADFTPSNAQSPNQAWTSPKASEVASAQAEAG